MVKLRIAFFSPLNPMPTGISDYSEELLPALAELAEVDVFVDDYEPTNEALKRRLPIYSYRRYEELAGRRRYDVDLYQMGNSAYHAYIYEMLQRHPGVVVLHEPLLHHLLAEAFLLRGNVEAYVREIGYSHGLAGLAAARALARGQAVSKLAYPSFHRVVDAALGVIVHSEYAAGIVHAARPEGRVVRIPMVLTPPASVDARAAREELGILPDQLVIGSFGRLTRAKRIDVALRAFAAVRPQLPDAIYLLVGEATPECRLDELIADLRLGRAVLRTGYVPDLASFYRHVAACDICVNLRYPTAGETSAAALRLLALGRPTIVTDAGAFSELPDGCCIKVPVGPDEEASLTRQLLALAGDPGLRKRLGGRAREFVAHEHAPGRVARLYVAALEEFCSFGPEALAGLGLAGETALALTDLGLSGVDLLAPEPKSGLSRCVNKALAELGLADGAPGLSGGGDHTHPASPDNRQ